MTTAPAHRSARARRIKRVPVRDLSLWQRLLWEWFAGGAPAVDAPFQPFRKRRAIVIVSKEFQARAEAAARAVGVTGPGEPTLDDGLARVADASEPCPVCHDMWGGGHHGGAPNQRSEGGEVVMTEKRFETLTRLECLELLRENHLGRLAFLERVGVVPLIMPVNYVLDQDAVVFRTDPGSKLVAAVRGAPVAFEIDGAEEGDRVGWSVIVRGHAVEVTDAAERERLSHGPLESWAPGPKSHYVRVVPGPITGRRIRVHPR